MTLVIDGTGPVAAVYRRALSGPCSPSLTVACSSLGAVDTSYRLVAPHHRFLVSVNGISPPLHHMLSTDPKVSALNFTAWFGISNGAVVVRRTGVVLASRDAVTTDIARRIANTFALTVVALDSALQVQISKLAINLPGVVFALAHHAGLHSALRLETATLRALSTFMEAHMVPVQDLGGFRVRRLLQLVLRTDTERDLAELESLVRGWRGGRAPEAARRIARGAAGSANDLLSTLLHIGLEEPIVQRVIQASGACQS